MMTKMREFSKIFIIIVAASFIGLMVFQWGANYSGRKQRSDVVGKVNDHELKYTMFSKLYQQVYEEEKARTGKSNFTEEDLQRMRDKVWERFVQQTLLQDEIKRMGITVTDSEIVYQIYNFPLEDFKQHPSFQTNGVFDMKKYHASFANPNIPWMQVEQIYRQQIPYMKLQALITNAVRVSDKEVLDAFKKRNLKAKAEYLAVLANRFNSDKIAVSEQEIQAYYDEHKEDFKQNEKRELSYVLFPVNPTKEDTARLMQEVEEIKKRLANGEDFNQLAREYSEDPSVLKNNGELGYFDRNTMVKPFSDAAFSAKVGEVVGPVQTPFGFHLIKVEDRKKEKGVLKVKASHILLKVAPAPSRVEQIETQARFFSEDAKDYGFDQQAKKQNLEVYKTGLFEEGAGFIPGIGQNFAIKNWTFSAKLNDVSGVYRIDRGYVVAALTKIQPAGYKSLESQKKLIESRIRLEKAKEMARQFAQALKPKVDSDTPFKTIADQDTSGKIMYNVTPLFTMEQSIPGIGRSVEFAATAFALQPGQKSDMVETARGFYYLKLLEKTKLDTSAFNAQKESLRRQLLLEKKNQVFQEWYNNLKKHAEIEDNRKLFNL
ncbi:MAG TPA: hypothetical protein ENJ89_02690 [Caldithrix abyssi]|uniref:Periplasmic chaperone PpiD n=1 Tax=Caldithrix abyssi TaxID=187145 RepID=A0A7V5UE89_CALAY|nr:hypothetical protein [Caldithrix abyssi]